VDWHPHCAYKVVIASAKALFHQDYSVGKTVKETEREIREAIAFHLEGMREDGQPIPPPTSSVEYVDIAA